MSILDIKELLAKRIQDSAAKTNEKPAESTIITHCKHGQGQKLSLREVDVGITEYLRDLPGFFGVIKQRYSDFSVHEIDKEHKIVVLDSCELPNETPPKSAATDVLDSEYLKKLESLMEENSNTNVVEIDVTKKTREERKDIHQFVKDTYGTSVVSNTVDKDEKKFISVTRSCKGNRDSRWPGHLPKNLHFVLCKSNLDTTHALNVLAKKLRLKQDRFSIAGTKDKRALTTQRVSVKSVYAKQLKNLNKSLRQMYVGNFEYKEDSLGLGDLKGNNFEIALRDVTAPDDEIERSMTELKDYGFINYFGMQRFGMNAECPTHLVGKFLIKGQFAQAFDFMMKPRSEFDAPEMKSAREIYTKTRDAGQALSALRNNRSIEGQLLFGLKVNGPNAYANAFDLLPRNVRFLFIHAFQSFVWNKAVSKRLQKYGTSVLEGDLVLIDTESTTEDELLITTEDLETGTVEKELDEKIEETKTKPCPVRHITADELSKYSIEDIQMPLPGHSSLYPNNDTSEFYKEILAEDGLTIDSFTERQKYSTSGGYRHIVKKPQNLKWRIVNYEKDVDDLIMSDIDTMQGKNLPELKGDKKAAIVCMDLDKSTYATMALREVLRCDTSWAAQAGQTLKAKREAEDAEGGPTDVKRRKETNGGSHGMAADEDTMV